MDLKVNFFFQNFGVNFINNRLKRHGEIENRFFFFGLIFLLFNSKFSMDNSPAADPNNHSLVFDPQLGPVHNSKPNISSENTKDDQQQQAKSSGGASALNSDGNPIKRRPGRPKGSTKKNLLAGEVLPPKLKRPVGRPRKDGLPAGSVGASVRLKREATTTTTTTTQQAGLPVVSSLMYMFNYRNRVLSAFPKATLSRPRVSSLSLWIPNR